MGINKAILLFYSLYTAYTVLVCGTTDLSLVYVLPALILVWMLFAFFYIGYTSVKKVPQNINRLSLEDDKLFGIRIRTRGMHKLFLIGLISIGISVICAHYYTGHWPKQVLQNISFGESNYIKYQLYFKSANISTFSLAKVPYIVLLGINNILFVYSYIFIICKNERIRIKHVIYLVMLALAHVYFGVARGTNFESYQLFILLVYCYVLRQYSRGKKINLLLIISLGIALVATFITVLAARGAEPNYRVAAHINYDPDGIFAQLFPHLSKYYLFLYSYLGFGIYYLATMINEVWLGSTASFFGAFIPFLNILTGADAVKTTNELVSIGVKWVPDAAMIINTVGMIILFLLCYELGIIVKKSSALGPNNGFKLLLGYIAFVFLITLPNGHFVTFSSEEILIVYTLFRYFLCRIRFHARIAR